MSTLQHTSHTLLGEILKPSNPLRLPSLLADTDVDWFNFLELIGNTLITPTIARKLDSPELTPLIPEEIREVLELIRDRNRFRNKDLRDTFLRTASLLRKIDVNALPLKGAWVLLNDIYPDSADRIISDIDLLIHPAELDRTLRLLQAEGYVQRCNPFLGDEGRRDYRFEAIDPNDFRNTSNGQNYHVPPIKENMNSQFCIEIHTRPCEDNIGTGAELNRLAFHRPSSLREQSPRLVQPGLSFTLMHTAHHMLIQDKLRYLGMTDYRHLQDVDQLLFRIEKNGETGLLLELAESEHFRDLYTFLLWQSENVLGSQHTPQFRASEKGTEWIEDFRKVSAKPSLRRLRTIVSITKTRVPRLLSTQALSHAFGDMPFSMAAPLYLKYQYKRVIAEFRHRTKSRQQKNN